MEKINKWRSIDVVKAVRVVMKFQSAVALGVVLAVATPELMNLGSQTQAQNAPQRSTLSSKAVQLPGK